MPPWSAPSLNPVDALAVAIVLLYVVQAYGHGWLLTVVQLAGFVLALLVTLGGYAPLARQIVASSALGYGLAKPLAFLVLWVLSVLLYGAFVRAAFAREW